MADSDLDSLDTIQSELPFIIPRGPIDVDGEQYRFQSGKHVYFVRKAPVHTLHRVTGTLSGRTDHEFIRGTDYELIDGDNDGEDDSIDWSIGGDTPDNGTDFSIDYRADSVIARYVSAHDDDVASLETDIDAVIKSGQVNRAEGGNLSRVGAIFGEIGRRANRNDEDYRFLLKSIVQSFDGRGTIPGIRFAISAGTGISEENITIVEDTDNTGYEIEIDQSVSADIIGGVINDMAELADPSGVKLLAPAAIQLSGDEITYTLGESTVTSSDDGLGAGILNMDGSTQLT